MPVNSYLKSAAALQRQDPVIQAFKELMHEE